MRLTMRLRAVLGALAVMLAALGLAACGDNNDNGSSGGGGGGKAIARNPDNAKVRVTVGSKNFTEQIVLGEVYAQALQAAGYKVKKDLNLGSEQIAFSSLKKGEVDAYPEYASTALTSFYDVKATDVPQDAQAAFDQAKPKLEADGVKAFPPTPFESANAVGMLKSKADKLGVKTVSDLKGKSQDLTLYGSPECRQRVDCLVGLNKDYGLKFKSFKPVDIGLRYEVLDKGQADLSILFTTDAMLASSDKYVLLTDDKKVFPPGNVLFLAREATVKKAGSDFGKTVEAVQKGLTDKVMQELTSRVDIDKQEPAQAARAYLRDAGFVK